MVTLNSLLPWWEGIKGRGSMDLLIHPYPHPPPSEGEGIDRFAQRTNPPSFKNALVIVLYILLFVFICNDVHSEAVSIESLLPKDIPDGWTLIDGPHIYTKKTLFEHINGQAELFFKYGFQKSVFAIYQNKKTPENQIELDIYDMGNILQAFGIFSRFRNENRPGGIGLDSYLDDRSAFFYKGKYFVMLYATESNPSILRQLSMTVSLKILDLSPPPKEIAYFPQTELKPGSIQYFPEGLLGHQFLKRGFQGTYVEKVEAKVEAKAEVKAEAEAKAKAEGKEFRLFLAVFKNSQEAMSALRIYRDYLTQKGKIDPETPTRFGFNTLKGEDPYQGQVIIVHKGFYLLGVAGFEREEEGENRLTELIKNMK